MVPKPGTDFHILIWGGGNIFGGGGGGGGAFWLWHGSWDSLQITQFCFVVSLRDKDRITG